MARKSESSSAKKKQPAAKMTSQEISDQTAAFLNAGGQIQRIKPGVSGQQNQSGPRHITIGNK